MFTNPLETLLLYYGIFVIIVMLTLFYNRKYNLVGVTKQAKNTYHYTLLYNQSTNMVNQDVKASKRIQEEFKSDIVKYWDPALVGWLKWNANAFKIDARQSITIGTFCKDNKERIQYSN